MAQRTFWTVHILSSGNAWVLDANTIHTPNENLELPKISNQTRIILADGSPAYMVPETKYLDEALSLTWVGVDKTFKDLLESYLEASYTLKLTDENNETYVGKFTDVRPVWLKGIDGLYDLTATFAICINPSP